MSEVGEAVIGVLADVLDTEIAAVTPDTEFSSLEDWDSMAALEVLMQLESELQLQLNLRNYNELRTVGDLIGLAEAELAGSDS
ncbi:MAG TPA: acyl carrier protein [Pseudonocardiaceae bacterium]|nr:acyl carrier protein [Pseudonocardiaceae bacterium]